MRSRAKIINATLDLIQASGFGGVTIAAVAESAGVSRQTVYSIFGTREDLVSQSIAHLTLTAMEDIRAAVAATGNPTDFLVELIMAGREFARNTPALTAMLRATPSNPLVDTDVLKGVRPVAMEFLSPLNGQLRDLDDVADLILHLSLSIVLFDDRSDADLRRILRRWLAPVVNQVRMTPRS